MEIGEVSEECCNLYLRALHLYWGLNGHTVDDTAAVEAFANAAEFGHPGAQLQMGVFYKCGGLVPQDKELAVKLFKTVAKKVPWFKERANDGDALAQWQLSRLIAHGVIDSCDSTQWCRLAAEQGYALAQFDLSQCYHDGEGVPKDSTQAAYWCQLAADQMMVEAGYWIGSYLRDGCGTKKDDTSALNWLRAAASRGHGGAQRVLSRLYSTPTNRKKGRKWLRNSSDNNSKNPCASRIIKPLTVRLSVAG